jgi:hypothetical protein
MTPIFDRLPLNPITRAKAHRPDPPLRFHASLESWQAAHSVPASVPSVLASPAQPLDPSIQAEMGARFGHDFSRIPAHTPLLSQISIGPAQSPEERGAQVAARQALSQPAEPARRKLDFSGVRIHTGGQAAQSAQAVNALAYTVGNDIVFGEGQYAPGTGSGRQLLAHELAHVAQGTGATLHRQVASQGGTGTTPANNKAYKVKIPPGTKTAQEFRRYAELVIFGRVLNLPWTATEALQSKYADISHHVGEEVRFVFPASLVAAAGVPSTQEKAAGQAAANQDYAALSGEQRESVNAEIDRRYFQSINDPAQEKIKKGETGKIAIWNSFKQQVLADKRKLEALPQGIQDILGSSGTYRPEDYDQLNRMAGKLMAISPADWADYKSKVNRSTTSLDDLEASIDRYLAERAWRQKQIEQREQIKAKLYGPGLLHLYQRLKDWKSLKGSATMVPSSDEFGVRDPNAPLIRGWRDDAHDELVSQLPRYGFADISAFEQAIDAYETAFRQETVNIAFDMLAKYEHVLYEADKKFSDPANAAAIYQGLSQTQAKAHYQQAEGAESLASAIKPDPDLHRYLPGEYELKREKESEAASARGSAEAEVKSVVKGNPLLEEEKFDRQKLAEAGDFSAVQKQILAYIQKQREGINETRTNLTEDTDLVYTFDKLRDQSFKEQRVEPGTIYYEIIIDHIKDKTIGKVLKGIALAILAIAFTIATFGAGAVAVVGALGMAGISAYQAYESFHDYEVESSANKAGLLSEEPSLFWVIVAVVGAGIDLAAVGTALKALRPAVEAFNATSDISTLEKSLANLRKLGEINEAIEANVVRAAKAEMQFRSAASQILASGGRLRAVVVPFAEEFGQFMVAAYYLAKRGVIAFDRYLLELKAQKLIGEIKDLSPENLVLLQKAFAEGIEKSKTGLIDVSKVSAEARSFYPGGQLEEVAARGKALGLEDEQIATWLEKGSAAKKSAKQIEDEMAAAAEAQRLAKRFEKMSDQDLHALLDKDPDASYELLRRLKLTSPVSVAKQEKLTAEIAEVEQEIYKIRYRNNIRVPEAEGQKALPLEAKLKSLKQDLENEITAASGMTENTIKELRAATPFKGQGGTQARQQFLDNLPAAQRGPGGGPIDYVTGKELPVAEVSLDHIYPVDRIFTEEGFGLLPRSDQKAILDMEKNLAPMDKALNSSKGDRDIASWLASDAELAPKLTQAQKTALLTREAEARQAVRAEIARRLYQWKNR